MAKTKPEIPDEKTFIDYCREVVTGLGLNFDHYEFQLKTKYETWVENKWRDGYDKPITNWKLKARTAISYTKPMYNAVPKKGGMVY